MLSYIIVFSIMYWLATSWLRLPNKSTAQVIGEIDEILEREKDLLPRKHETCERLDSSDVAATVLVEQLQGMTVKQLKAFAKSYQLTGYSQLRKADLIQFIINA
jgi:hypothetical protein